MEMKAGENSAERQAFMLQIQNLLNSVVNKVCTIEDKVVTINNILLPSKLGKSINGEEKEMDLTGWFKQTIFRLEKLSSKTDNIIGDLDRLLPEMRIEK